MGRLYACVRKLVVLPSNSTEPSGPVFVRKSSVGEISAKGKCGVGEDSTCWDTCCIHHDLRFLTKTPVQLSKGDFENKLR